MTAIIIISLFGFLIWKLSTMAAKPAGWPAMEQEIFLLAENTYFQQEAKEIRAVVSQADPDSLARKVPVYRLAIDILISFDPDQIHLQNQLKLIRYGNELVFERELQQLINKKIPECYREN